MQTLRELQYPRADAQCRTQLNSNRDTVRDYLHGLRSSEALAAVGLSAQCFVLERLPLTLQILDPLTPAAFAVLSRAVSPQQGAAVLARLVDGLRFYQLDYAVNEGQKPGKQPRLQLKDSVDASYVYRYRLDPPLDAIARLVSQAHLLFPPGSEPPARECDAVLHKVFLKLRPLVVREGGGGGSGEAASPSRAAPPTTASAAPPQLAPLLPQAVPAVLRDFFGRVVVAETAAERAARTQTAAPATTTAAAVAAAPLPVVRFKFNAGFTNAVRRTVYMKDFLN